MKKIILLLCLAFPLAACAQSYRHELRASFGMGSDHRFNQTVNRYIDRYGLEKEFVSFGILRGVNLSAQLEYYCHLNRRIAIGGAVGYGSAYGRLVRPYESAEGDWLSEVYLPLIYPYDWDDPGTDVESRSLSVMPGLKVTWLEAGPVVLYSKGNAGLRHYRLTVSSRDYPEINDSRLKFAFQLSPVGVEVGGRHVKFFTEIGYGQQGIVTMGAVWHFAATQQ